MDNVYVVNDLHGNPKLIEKTVDAIKRMEIWDYLIVNGDGAGARGPIMNELVKIFYEVRRGETEYGKLTSAIASIIGEEPEFPKSWVFDSVHAGVFRAVMAKRYEAFRNCVEKELLEVIDETICPIAEAAEKAKVNVLYVPGNGEIVPSDFDTEDITVEKTLPPEERFYQRIAREGYFDKFHRIKYVPYAYVLQGHMPFEVVVLSTNLLDLPRIKALNILSDCRPLGNERPKRIVVHYPPTISSVGKIFDFWTPNRVDVSRTDALQSLLEHIYRKTTVFFGHVHLPADDSRMNAYPPTIGFDYERSDYDSLWVKPGEVIKIKW